MVYTRDDIFSVVEGDERMVGLTCRRGIFLSQDTSLGRDGGEFSGRIASGGTHRGVAGLGQYVVIVTVHQPALEAHKIIVRCKGIIGVTQRTMATHTDVHSFVALTEPYEVTNRGLELHNLLLESLHLLWVVLWSRATEEELGCIH